MPRPANPAISRATADRGLALATGPPSRVVHEADPDEGLARARERVAERLNGGHVHGRRAGHVPGGHDVVVEGEVDDCVRAGRGLAQAVEIAGVAEADFGAEGLHGSGRGLGPGKARDLVSGLEKFGDRRPRRCGRWRR